VKGVLPHRPGGAKARYPGRSASEGERSRGGRREGIDVGPRHPRAGRRGPGGAKGSSASKWTFEAFFRSRHDYEVDFAEVRGQATLKAGLEIAATGGHKRPHGGPPVRAKRAGSPDSDDPPGDDMGRGPRASRVYSVMGIRAAEDHCCAPPVSDAPPHGLGCGADLAVAGPRCGEISLAHNGLLFLDELSGVQEARTGVLRQPLEDGTVTIARAATADVPRRGHAPVAAMNPCACGYPRRPPARVHVSSDAIRKYRRTGVRPLLDRFDICVDVPAVRYRDIAAPLAERGFGTDPRARVAGEADPEVPLPGTRIHCNAQMTPAAGRAHCDPAPGASGLLEHAMDRMGLSARAYNASLKTARSVADWRAPGSSRRPRARGTAYRNPFLSESTS